MASKEIANEDRIIQITSNGAWTPGPAAGMNYIETLASKAKANSKFILINQISWIALGCVWAGHNFVTGASVAPILATATKCKCDNMFVLRKDDEGDCVGQFINIGTGNPAPCSCKYKIQDAGQTKAKAS